MRPGGSGKRARNNRNHSRRGGGGGGNRNQSFDSNGPDVKVRGSAAQVAEKYAALARDASSTGDRVAAENYLQHAEHYTRIVNANNEKAAEAARERAERERQEEPQQGEAVVERTGNGAAEPAEAEQAADAVEVAEKPAEADEAAAEAEPAEAKPARTRKRKKPEASQPAA